MDKVQIELDDFLFSMKTTYVQVIALNLLTFLKIFSLWSVFMKQLYKNLKGLIIV